MREWEDECSTTDEESFLSVTWLLCPSHLTYSKSNVCRRHQKGLFGETTVVFIDYISYLRNPLEKVYHEEPCAHGKLFKYSVIFNFPPPDVLMYLNLFQFV